MGEGERLGEMKSMRGERGETSANFVQKQKKGKGLMDARAGITKIGVK